MILSMSHQTLLFLSTVGAGMAIGLIYDVFRIIRKTAPHGTAIIQLEDLLFWVAVTLLMFYFMLNKNYGEIRLFVILGTVLGMVLYFATISLLIMKVSVAVINFVKKVIATVVHILLTPVRLLIKLLTPPALYVTRAAHKGLHSVKRYAKIKVRKTIKSWSVIRRKV